MTNEKLSEILRPLIDNLFGSDGYFLALVLVVIGLMIAFAFCSWLAHFIVYRDRRKNDDAGGTPL